MHLARAAKGLEFNLAVYGEGDWGAEARKRLIDESVALLDEILLDSGFLHHLQIAYETQGVA
jgi:hypothetical protein